MNLGEEPSADSIKAANKSKALNARAEAKVETAYLRAKYFTTAVFDAVQFVLFLLFTLTAILRFWLLCATLVLHLIRVALHLLTIPLRTAAGASPKRQDHKKAYFFDVGNLAPTLYFELVKPFQHFWLETTDGIKSFWHYTFARKTLVVTLSFLLVIVPGSYLVPRTHTVQILDNNVLNNQSSKLDSTSVGYLIHAIDLDDPSHTREYSNEDAWWLGKVNSQGIKASLVPGRYYKIRIVGLRWWYAPTLYPNIISVVETDAKGDVLENPSTFIPATTTGK
jgi:hypothetical protein